MLKQAFHLFGDHAPAIFVGFVLASLAATAWQQRRVRRPGAVADTAATAVSGTSFLAVKFVAGTLVFATLATYVFDHYRLFTLNMHSSLVWVVVFLGRDHVYYWVHRCEHRVRCLWASHMVHHSPENISPVTALRVPWMEALYKPWFSLWMPFVGFNPVAAVSFDVLAACIGQLQHTTRFTRHTVLDWVFVTPSTHRVHHGCNHEYLDKNFGAVFVVWDRLWGTYQREGEPVRYGVLGHRLGSAGDMLRGGFPDLWADVRRAVGLKGKVKVALGPPGAPVPGADLAA